MVAGTRGEPVNNLVTLENDVWKLEIVPDVGASVYGLSAMLGGVWQPIMRPTTPESLAAKKSSACSSFTLAPFSNRIKDAKFKFRGREFQLRPTTPDGGTQHGDVRNRPWRVEQTGNSLGCFFDSRDFADINFPFAFTMRVTYSLEGSDFLTTLELENVGPETMPAGFGIHPYFVHSLLGSGDAVLQFAAKQFHETDAGFIPNAPAVNVTPELDFSKPRGLAQTQLNHCFTAWDGRARLSWPGSKVHVELEAGEVFSHLIAFTSPDRTVALEPVTHVTDGFNLLERGQGQTGVAQLEHRQCLRGQIRLRLGHT
jgi:aldose 1-epimerase